MSSSFDHSDGLSRLTEMMRQEVVLAEPAPAPVDPVRRRRTRRRRGIVAGIAALLVVALGGGYSAWALTAPIGSATLEATAPAVTVPPATELALTSGTASAVTLVGGDDYLGTTSGGVWMSTGDDAPRPMASITKLISALVVLEAKPLADADDPGPTLTFGRADHALYDKYYVLGASIAEMPIGSSMSQHEALEAMLVISACNYAEAVTTWAFGSQSAFLRAARAWLTAQGLDGTTIVEPTGLDPRNTSTPTDLLALGRLALANPAVAQIVAMERLDVPNIPPAFNTNDLVQVDGITGLKTGTLEESGANLLFSATIHVGLDEPLQIVGVVLGALGRDSISRDVRALLDDLRAGFHHVPLGARGDTIGTYSTVWGEEASVELAEDATVYTWSDTPVTTTFELGTLTAGSRGDVVGEITWVAGPRTVTVPLVLGDDIPPPDTWWRLTHPFELGG